LLNYHFIMIFLKLLFLVINNDLGWKNFPPINQINHPKIIDSFHYFLDLEVGKSLIWINFRF
jgi:hypothetical protein